MINDVIQKKSWQKKPRFPNEVIISGLTGCVFTMRRRGTLNLSYKNGIHIYSYKITTRQRCSLMRE